MGRQVQRHRERPDSILSIGLDEARGSVCPYGRTVARRDVEADRGRTECTCSGDGKPHQVIGQAAAPHGGIEQNPSEVSMAIVHREFELADRFRTRVNGHKLFVQGSVRPR